MFRPCFPDWLLWTRLHCFVCFSMLFSFCISETWEDARRKMLAWSEIFEESWVDCLQWSTTWGDTGNTYWIAIRQAPVRSCTYPYTQPGKKPFPGENKPSCSCRKGGPCKWKVTAIAYPQPHRPRVGSQKLNSLLPPSFLLVMSPRDSKATRSNCRTVCPGNKDPDFVPTPSSQLRLVWKSYVHFLVPLHPNRRVYALSTWELPF